MPDRRKNTYRLAQSQIGHPHDRFSQLLSSASCRPSGLAILTYILIRQDSISSPQVSLSACKAQSKRIVPVGSGQRPFTHLWFRYSRTSRPTQAPALTSALDSTSTQSSARESGYFKISGFLSDAPYLSKREDCPLPFQVRGSQPAGYNSIDAVRPLPPALPALLDDPSYPYSEFYFLQVRKADLPSFSEREDFPLC